MQNPSTTRQNQTLLERLQGASLVGATLGEELYRTRTGAHILVAWIGGDTCRIRPVSPAEARAWARLNLTESAFRELFQPGGDS